MGLRSCVNYNQAHQKDYIPNRELNRIVSGSITDLRIMTRFSTYLGVILILDRCPAHREDDIHLGKHFDTILTVTF